MSFSAYPGYKDSGIAWLGAIPKHWLLYRSKNVFSERNIKALESDEQLTASQKYGVIPQKLFSELENQKVMQVILGRDILKKAEVNDFVISMRSFQGGLEFSSYSGAVSSAYVPLYANRELDNIFLSISLNRFPSYLLCKIQAILFVMDKLSDITTWFSCPFLFLRLMNREQLVHFSTTKPPASTR